MRSLVTTILACRRETVPESMQAAHSMAGFGQ
jgi:hypothetical protein